MVRARWATLTLAGTLMLTSSGCFNLFSRWRTGTGTSYSTGAECTCNDMAGAHGAMIPAGAEFQSSGPTLIAPDAQFAAPPYASPPQIAPPYSAPPGITPMGPPPRIVPIPATSQATPMPWTGQH